MNNYETYLSPYTWRYGSDAMRQLWSEVHKRRLWRRIWLALAEAQTSYGLVTAAQVEELRAQVDAVNVERALEIEAEIQHDLMAELKTFAEVCPTAGGIIHLGATSMDIEDNADALRLQAALDLILTGLTGLLKEFATQMDTWADLPVIAFTHLQPAEPSTLGYRFALYAQDLLEDTLHLRAVRRQIRGKGFKGAVGTGAAYGELIGVDELESFEEQLSESLGLEFYPVANQTYPRKQDYQVISALAGVAASLYKFAFDLRFLQSPPIGELAEPFGSRQVGSSAMPFKRNPIHAEKIDSLARLLAAMPRTAWDNASHSLLERTLDDSANRRTLLPEAFLIADEILRVATRLVKGLQVDQGAIRRNLSVYGPFAATERILMAAAKAGADRQEIHEILRGHAMQAWGEAQQGKENPLMRLLAGDARLLEYLTIEQVMDLMDASQYVGQAPKKTRALAEQIRSTLGI